MSLSITFDMNSCFHAGCVSDKNDLKPKINPPYPAKLVQIGDTHGTKITGSGNFGIFFSRSVNFFVNFEKSLSYKTK